MSSPYSNPSTSKAAAVRTQGKAADQRADMLGLIRLEPRTDGEIGVYLDSSGNSVRPRRWELANMGLIRDSGHRRPTPSGHPAIVWEAVRPPPLGVDPRDKPPRRVSSRERALADAYQRGYEAGLMERHAAEQLEMKQ